jgi:hypothetical protein
MHRIFNPDLSIPERIKDIIRREIDEYHVDTEHRLSTLDAFRAAFREPEPVTVTFSSGTRQSCWAITRLNGAYRVVFLPRSGYFSLCAISESGLLDIGVHGSAIGCFSAA